VEPECTCNVPLKTGYAYAHVPGVAPFLKKSGKDPDQNTYAYYSPGGYKVIFGKHFSDYLSLSANYLS
jgi:hypothetical protein